MIMLHVLAREDSCLNGYDKHACGVRKVGGCEESAQEAPPQTAAAAAGTYCSATLTICIACNVYLPGSRRQQQGHRGGESSPER